MAAVKEGTVISWLSSMAQGLLKNIIIKPIATVVSIVFMWRFHAHVKTMPSQAFNQMKDLSELFYLMPKEWSGFLAGYIEKMTGMRITPEDIARQGAGIGARDFMTAFGDKFLSPMLGLIMPTPQEIKANPMGGANRFMATNLQFQLSAWMLHVLGDFVSFGAIKSLKDLPNAISWSYGIGWLSWLVMGPPFRAGIAAPMEKLFARMYTPNLLTQTQLASLARHKLLTYEQYIDHCLNNGMHPDQAAMLYEAQEKELSDAWLRRLVQMGWLGKGEITTELTRRGYGSERAEALSRLIIDDRKLDIIDKIIRGAEELYKDGVLTRTELGGYLDKAGYTNEEAELLVAQLEVENSRRRFLTPAQVTQLWLNKKWGRVEAKDYLINNLHYTPEDAEAYMALRQT